MNGLAALIRAEGVRELHCGRCLPEGFMAWLLSWWAGLPYVCYVHGEDVMTAGTSRELSWMVRRVLGAAKFVVANSRNTARLLTGRWGLAAERVRLLYPGVDTTRFVPAARDLLQPLEEKQDPRRHAADHRDRQSGALLGQVVDLRIPVAQQSQVQRRKRVGTQERNHFARRDAAQVAAQDHLANGGGRESLQLGAAAEEEHSAPEQRRAGMHSQEEGLAQSGELRGGSNLGRGQVKAADYFLIPDIANSNQDSGGNNYSDSSTFDIAASGCPICYPPPGTGTYVLQAAIADLHLHQPRDWHQIAALYGTLAQRTGSPVVELNRAVAIAMRDSPQAGLKAVDAILERNELQDYYLLHSVRADLFRRLGETAQARSSYEKALSFTRLEPARRFLEKRLNELSDAG